MKRLVPALLLPLMIGPQAGAGWAQDSRPYESVTESARLFDSEAATTFSGVIRAIETVRLEHGAPFVQIVLKIDDGSLPVHLGPAWYMRDKIQRLELDIGREVEVTASPTTVAGEAVLVAAEIINHRRNQRLRLRHQDGTPVWAGGERVPDPQPEGLTQ